jgi:1A family penicillin-binding protein
MAVTVNARMEASPVDPAPATAERPSLGRWLAHAVALATGMLTVMLALAVAAPLLGEPVVRMAAGSVQISLGIPEDAALPQLGERSIVYAADGTVLAVLHDEVDRHIVSLDEVPVHIRQAILTAEDRRFYDHDGYDVEGIGRAFLANVRARRITQGGSTITQQLAKQNFVGADQTLERKVSELLYAMALEEQFTKEELLERYLNQVYFGAGAYGIAAAAEEFFRVRPEQLGVDQAALLAGLIRAPGRLDPRKNPTAALRRRNLVLAGMAQEGYLTRDEAEQFQRSPMGVLPPEPPRVSDPYFVEAVKREFFANPAFGETRQERIERLFTGGLHLYTTLDPRLQAIADDVVAQTFDGSDGPTGAIAAIDPRTGRVLALHSGADFSEEQFDLATQGRRQPGSAFKPFVLAAALQHGFPLQMTLPGRPVSFKQPGWREPWDVRNYGNATYGPLSLHDALVRSVNTAFAQLIMVVGVDETIEMATTMGIHRERSIGTDVGPAISLGGLQYGVTPLEMASAFGTFANEGRRVPPFLIERVLDHHGREVFVAATEAHQVLDPVVNAAMVNIMQDVVVRGTARRASLPGWQAAGKTGTTQNSADAWFIGFVPTLSTAVWVGHPQGQVRMPGMTGGSLPAQLWQQFMVRALEGVEPVPFPDVAIDLTHIASQHSVEVPDVRRMSEQEAFAELASAKLVADVRAVPAHAPAGVVVWQSPRAGTVVRAGESVMVGVSTGVPPPPEPEEDEEGDDDGESGGGEAAPGDGEAPGGTPALPGPPEGRGPPGDEGDG